MKTKKEIETKLQDLEAAILNKREKIRTADHPTGADYLELQVMEHQAKSLKWVLS